MESRLSTNKAHLWQVISNLQAIFWIRHGYILAMFNPVDASEEELLNYRNVLLEALDGR